MLFIKEISKEFSGRSLFQNCSFTFEKGHVYGITGDNGIGKSTFFHCIMGLSQYKGRVQLNGVDIDKKSTVERVRSGIGYLPQIPSLLVGETGLLNLKLSVNIYYKDKRKREDLVTRIIEELELSGFIKQKVSTLSFGEKRILELATILLNRENQSCLLLDEPVGGIDEKNRAKISSIVKRESTSGKVILIIEHDRGFLRNICNSVLIIQDQGFRIHAESS